MDGIKIVEELPLEEFHRCYLSQHIPVVIKSGAGHWPAVEKWTPDYLKRVAGKLELKVKSSVDYENGLSKRENEDFTILEVSELIDLVFSNHPPDCSYARETDLLKRQPLLLNDIDRLPLLIPKDSRPRGPMFWMGPENTVAQLHWDSWHNIFVQVVGQKQFILVPPVDASCTYPNQFSLSELRELVEVNLEEWEEIRSDDGKVRNVGILDCINQLIEKFPATNPASASQLSDHILHTLDDESIRCLEIALHDINNCHVDVGSVDNKQHPLFSNAKQYEVTLNQGDILFLPYLWRHYVRSLSPNVSVNWFFHTGTDEKEHCRSIRDTIVDHLRP